VGVAPEASEESVDSFEDCVSLGSDYFRPSFVQGYRLLVEPRELRLLVVLLTPAYVC